MARADDNKIGWKDALAGAALCGKNKSVLLLGDAVKYQDAADFIKKYKAPIQYGYVYGGTSAVPAAAMKAFENASK